MKCNTDRSADRGAPGPAACGGFFRDHCSTSLGCFAGKIGIANSFVAELHGAMLAIELASRGGIVASSLAEM